MKKALVTGANGHIGANLVRELLAHDYAVVGLVREGSDLRGLAGVNLELVRGDVLDAEAVGRAMAGVTHLFHLAAPYVVWARDGETIVGPAVRGTDTALRAAKAHGVERAVVTGSCNAVGFTCGEPLDETSWRERAASPYMRAKREQELCARELAGALDLDVVTVLPTAVLGPLDFRMTPTTAPFVDVLRGRGPVPFPMNLVDVRDVARGHRLAAERGGRGERYLLGGDNADTETIASLIEKHTAKRPKQGLPPGWVLRAVAAVAEATSAVTGKAPMLTRALLDDAGGGAPLFRIDKARAELGFEPRGAEDVIVATIEWARTMQWF